MATFEFDPRSIPVEAFAKQAGALQGEWPLAQFERLADAGQVAQEPGPDRQVRWQARGELRDVQGGERQVWLHLQVRAGLSLVCQRCLRPMPVAVEEERSFLFVHGEAAAEKLDAEIEEDVLATTRSLDLFGLVEDELLLALPLVPRHEPACPKPLVVAADAQEAGKVVNPFAALASLKQRPPLN
jgi:uncharacterized protein